MARSPVDLANVALGYLVRDTIRSLDGTDPSTVQVKAFMDMAKEQVLEEYDWPTCRVISPLTPVALVNHRAWAFAYEFPVDAVKVWRVDNGLQATREVFQFEVGMSDDVESDRTYIFTDLAGAYARYGSSRVSVGRLSPLLFDLVGLKLACMICMVLTKNAKLRDSLESQYARKLSKLITATANSEPEVVDQEYVPEVIRVRSE